MNSGYSLTKCMTRRELRVEYPEGFPSMHCGLFASQKAGQNPQVGPPGRFVVGPDGLAPLILTASASCGRQNSSKMRCHRVFGGHATMFYPPGTRKSSRL